MPFEKKIAAFDLDGTVTESRCEVKPDMVQLLLQLTEKTKVVIISGSSFGNFKKQFLSLWLNNTRSENSNKNLYVLPANGSQRYEYDTSSDSWIMKFEEKFSPELKKKVFEVLDQLIKEGSKYDLSKPEDIIGPFYEDRGSQISIAALGIDAPIEMKKLWDREHKKRSKIIKEFLSSKLPDNEIVIGGTTTIDILPAGFNKGKGLQIFLQSLGMDVQDMVFVGDSIFPGGNDFSPGEVGIQSIQVDGPTELLVLIKKWLS